MWLKFWSENMPITSQLTKELDLSDYWVILIQHWVKDAIDFWIMLNDNSKWDVLFLPKPYSQNKDDLYYWTKNWLKILNPWLDYENWLEKKWFLEDIISKFNNKLLLVIEVWWMFSNILKQDSNVWKNIKWLVEVTTFWHNRHLENWTNNFLPTYSVARSKIKEREARHVWLAIYRSIDNVLHELDRSVIDCNITMVWYWMIWKNVCRSFSWCEKLSVIDNDFKKVFEAQSDWFESSSNYNDVIWNSDIIIASTWYRSIDENFIKSCKDWVLLVSWWSRQNEIDVEFLEENTEEEVFEIHKFIKKYKINWKEVYLFREWKNANFSSNSCPSTSMDLIHAEVLTCVKNIIDWKYELWDKINETNYNEKEKLLKMHKNFWQ